VPLLGSAPSFALPGWLVAVVLVLTPSAAAVAALIPARRAVGVAIASALRR
jgi:ABC-type lipoprotein release transport system permease subunit